MKLKDYLKKAQKEKWAVGQFNFSTVEQLPHRASKRH